MKWILVALMSVSFASTAFAQLKPNFMTHEEAIRLSLAEPLKFIGQYIPDGSINRKPGCLLRNRYVTIAYSSPGPRISKSNSAHFHCHIRRRSRMGECTDADKGNPKGSHLFDPI